jgi:transcriptional regulator with XRE-family HTH domain
MPTKKSVARTLQMRQSKPPKEAGKTEDDMTMQGRIRMQMAANGIHSDAELARKLKLRRQTVHKWMNGDSKNLTPENIFRLSDVLKCSARWLMLGPPVRPDKPLTLDEQKAEVVHLYDAFGKNREVRKSWIDAGKALVRESTDPSPVEPLKRPTVKQ